MPQMPSWASHPAMRWLPRITARAIGQVPVPAYWLRLARIARILSWLTLAWMGVEGGVAIVAAVVAGSVALLGFGLDSGIEAMASIIVIWRFTGPGWPALLPSGAPSNWWRSASSCSPPTSPPRPSTRSQPVTAPGPASSAWRLPRPRPSSSLRSGGQAADRRPARFLCYRGGGNPEPAVRLPGDRSVRRAGRQHTVWRLVARRGGRARDRRLGGDRRTAGLGRAIVWLRIPVWGAVLILQGSFFSSRLSSVIVD